MSIIELVVISLLIGFAVGFLFGLVLILLE